MAGHNEPGSQIVLSLGQSQNLGFNDLSNARIGQPKRTTARQVNFLIPKRKSLSFGEFLWIGRRAWWQRTRQSSGHKDPFLLRMPVREKAAIEFLHSLYWCFGGELFLINCLLSIGQRQTKVCVTGLAW
jgi:hypothetical protein